MDFRKVSAVLFDLDGTLLDTAKDIGTCVNDVMCRYGYPARDLSEFPAFLGHGRNTLIRSALPDGTSDSEIEKLGKEYVPHYRENCARLTKPYPGAGELLQKLSENGYSVGMITNKTQEIAERLMQAYFPNISFDILWGNDQKRLLKPESESGLRACEVLCVRPEEVLFVGDGDTDMEFASACGFFPCGVTWGYRDRKTLLESGARLLIDDFSELYPLLLPNVSESVKGGKSCVF